MVTNFLHALSNLRQSQFILEGQNHTDDYPSWMIEITGTDGQHIQLFSASTGNPGSAPWNIIYNGRMYAQYEGSIAEPMAKLFVGKTISPAASFFPGQSVPAVAFSTSGWLPQLTSGFVGLLPIADGFQYAFDPSDHALHGTIEGRSSIGGFGNMIIGTITELVNVEVSTNDGKALDCTFEKLASKDPTEATWEFTCNSSNSVLDQTYDYPIMITFGTDKKEIISTEGRLQGIWHDPDAVLVVPLPDELQAALADNPLAADVLTDHVPIHAYYVASIDAANIQKGIVSGQIILLGEVTTPEGILRYTVGTPFAMKDGNLTVWSLSRQALEKMIKEITELALTKRVIKALPNVTLNLWYAESHIMPDIPSLINAYPESYGLTIRACGDLPSGSVPATEPLRAFGFETRWDFWLPDFVLMDGVPVVCDLTLYPNIADGEVHRSLAELLLPSALYTDTDKTFAAIRATFSSYRRELPELQFSVSKDASETERRALRKITDALPLKMDYQFDTTWVAARATFKVMDNGTLTLFGCDAKLVSLSSPTPCKVTTNVYLQIWVELDRLGRLFLSRVEVSIIILRL